MGHTAGVSRISVDGGSGREADRHGPGPGREAGEPGVLLSVFCAAFLSAPRCWYEENPHRGRFYRHTFQPFLPFLVAGIHD
jgi:hypothetical protein